MKKWNGLVAVVVAGVILTGVLPPNIQRISAANLAETPALEKRNIVEFNGVSNEIKRPVKNVNGRMMYPLRECLELLGATVSWDQNTNVATSTLNNKTIAFTIGSNKYVVDSVGKTMDVSPFLEDGTTYIPIRYAAEGFGFVVDYKQTAEANKIIIMAKTQDKPQITGAVWMNEPLETGKLIHSPMGNGSIGTYFYHQEGWDFIAEPGEPIYAVEDSEVTYYVMFGYTLVDGKKFWHYTDYGNWAVSKGEHTEIKYAHLKGYPTNVNGVNMQKEFENWLSNIKGKPLDAYESESTFVYDGSEIKDNGPIDPYAAADMKLDIVDYSKTKIGSVSFRKGDIIGYVGNTGYSFPPHLHVEYKYDGKPVMLPQIQFPEHKSVTSVGDYWQEIGHLK